MDTVGFLQGLGYSETEAQLFVAVYKYGPKPASSLAALAKLDRTYCYKVLQRLVRDKLVEETSIRGTKNFFVPNTQVFDQLLENKEKELQQLNQEKDLVQKELEALDAQKTAFVPQMVLFEGNNAIQRFYADILHTIKQRELLTLKFFASNTFTSDATKKLEYENIYTDFVQELADKKILLTGYIGRGVLVMDHLTQISEYEEIKKICPGQGSTYGYVVGKSLYMLQFKEIPIGFRLDSFDMTDMLHFLFENVSLT